MSGNTMIHVRDSTSTSWGAQYIRIRGGGGEVAIS